jgi:hypothetical protein
MTAQPKKTAPGEKIRARERPAAISLSWLDRLPIPEPERLAYYGGMAALAVFGLLEFPVAAVITAGHMLAHQRTNRALAELGEALEEA